MSNFNPRNDFRCHAILLAAGRGRRFDPQGQISKLHQSVQSNVSVVEQSARHLTSAIPQCHIVVRDASDWPASFLQQFSSSIVVCGDADLGMAHSLVSGVQTLPQECDAVVIALADMPFVTVSTIKAIVQALKEGAKIAVPVHQGQRGNPVGFSKALFGELLQLRGDQGARALLKSYPVSEVLVNDTGILRDIDTPADLSGPSAI
ncbi:nucleotidyltransferase family protein [Undibacterium sp. LX40W]|uniref:Nucleotidyltransferase family protein n=1 Tax=Undibacterium nitidum TaxID=2762298 RepID=A0A923KST0_9BURK|nr:MULTISPECIES: nucleotidyltransferase family protein [Undibacterium]MBC3881536.1 nucleotidyltransferase family protein [Undibacterium nitidum]MBC3891682.1 nucleotidyltransferase family protein [Undibacterium sp. LX40W]